MENVTYDKEWHRQYSKEHREEHNRRQNEWRRRHPDRVREYTRRSKEKDPGYSKRYWAAHKDEINARRRETSRTAYRMLRMENV